MRMERLLGVWSALAITALAIGAEKPRVYITESPASQASAEGSAGSLAYSGGTSPQAVEVMKVFSRSCPAVVVTSSREKADFVVRLDHEAINPTTPFVHGNKVAVFNRKEDLIYSNSSHWLNSAVKGACSAITGDVRTRS